VQTKINNQARETDARYTATDPLQQHDGILRLMNSVLLKAFWLSARPWFRKGKSD
jgi:hypothetical protein